MKKSHNNTANTTLIKYQFECLELQKFKNYSAINLLDAPISQGVSLEDAIFEGENKTKNNNLRPITTPFVKNIKTPFIHKQVDLGHFTPESKTQVVNEEKWLKESFTYLNSVWTNRVTVVLEENHDKLKLSIFRFGKKRQVGHKYFTKLSDDIHLTFNKTTKNFFITTSKFFNRKRQTSTRKNSVLDLKNIINIISFPFIMEKLVSLSTENFSYDIHLGRDNTLDQTNKFNKFIRQLQKLLCSKLKVKFNFKQGIGPGLMKGTLDWFVKERKLKVPNDYYYYMFSHYPGIRKLKRYKNNLGRAILDNMGLKGKYYIKLINTHGGYNLTDLMELKTLVGPTYAKLVSPSFLKLTNHVGDNKHNAFDIYEWTPTIPLHKTEKLNILKLLKDVGTIPKRGVTFLGNLKDHLQIREKLWKLGEKVRVRSKNLKNFNREHQEWSNLIHLHQRSIETHYQYDHKFLTNMEVPVNVNGNEYEVMVLKNDTDYFEEGQIQNHCVRSYLDKYDSIIISVRDKTNTLERMTVEFKGECNHNSRHIQSMKDYRGRIMMQSQMRFNQPPIGDWEKVKKILYQNFLKIKDIEQPNILQYNKITGQKKIFTPKHGKIEGEMFDFPDGDLPF